MDCIYRSTNVGVGLLVHSERPVALLVELLNKDTLEGLLLTSKCTTVVVIDSLYLVP